MNAIIDPDADLRARWLPTGHAVKLARSLFPRSPSHDLAVIPMIQPGKTRGIWTVGQPVKTVEGHVYMAVSREPRWDPDLQGMPPVQSLSEARDKACKEARRRLRGRPGTVAYAIVHRDEELGVAVFEDVL
jgi:hypothetical protein